MARRARFRSVIIVGGFALPVSPAYSIWRVIEEQVHILAALGLPVEVVLHGRAATPAPWPAGTRLTTFTAAQEGKRLAHLLRRAGRDVLFIAHDILGARCGLDLFAAINACVPEQKWVHWFHGHWLEIDAWWGSQYPQPNAWLVTQLEGLRADLASVFKLPLERVWAVRNHKAAAEFFGLGGEARTLLARSRWLDCEVRAVFPAQKTANKNWPGLFRFLAAVARQGASVGLLGLDTSIGEMPEDVLRRAARKYPQLEVCLASECGFPAGLPAPAVSQLFQLSNLFVLPSRQETCSLVAQEALLSKNLVVLNEAFAPIRELGGAEALYVDFPRCEGDEAYLRASARAVLSALRGNRLSAGQNRMLRDFSRAARVPEYRALLRAVAAAEVDGWQRLLSEPSLARPFRALLNPFVPARQLAPPLPPLAARGQTLPRARNFLQALGERAGVAGVGAAFLLLCVYEAGVRGRCLRLSAVPRAWAQRLAEGVTLLPLTPLLERYMARGYVAASTAELRQLLARRGRGARFLLMKYEDGASKGVEVGARDARALVAWLAGPPRRAPSRLVRALAEEGYLKLKARPEESGGRAFNRDRG